MKPISEMNLAELADALDALRPTHSLNGLVRDRLRELHEQTRWIPVSERMPTEADGDAEGYVLVRGVNTEGSAQHDIDLWHDLSIWNGKYWNLTHWKSITPPEAL
jgi:hypothetical protein